MPPVLKNRQQQAQQTETKTGWDAVVEKANSFVRNKFRDLGFKQIQKPNTEMPTTNTNFSELNNMELSRLATNYSQWREYAEDLHTDSLAAYTMLQEEYSFELAKRTKQASGKPTDKKIEAEADPRLRELGKLLLEAGLYRDMLGEKIKSFENCLSIISREISLRKNNS